jgi:Uma2 family endonuclease
MTTTLQRRLFTAEEYHKMAESGILPEKGVELLCGEIIDRSPIGSKHAAVVDRLNRLLGNRLPADYILRVQSPIRTDGQSEPEPDLAVLTFREDFYAGGLPTPADVGLLIEVSGRSLAYDREVKIPHYAGSGIPECWLVDLEADRIERYRQPVSGKYREVDIFDRSATLASESLGIEVEVEQVLPHLA